MKAAHPTSWSEHLLTGHEQEGWAHQGKRFATALGLASLFGVAIGLRGGLAAIATHAVGVALGILGVCGLAVPALAILLALADASASASGLARATSRAAANAGLLLAGLAPGAALFAVTVEDALTVTIVGAGGLALAGLVAMRSFTTELAPHLAEGCERSRRLSRIALPAFLLFAGVLGARIWWMSLPLVRGGS